VLYESIDIVKNDESWYKAQIEPMVLQVLWAGIFLHGEDSTVYNGNMTTQHCMEIKYIETDKNS
jgi:hypothetical protein